jgi:hypothetical protein
MVSVTFRLQIHNLVPDNDPLNAVTQAFMAVILLSLTMIPG